MELPSCIRVHQQGCRCHLHIEHGDEQGDRGMRESSARARRDQLDREVVDAGLIGIDLKRDRDQSSFGSDGFSRFYISY
jgi:hypothetical protein